MRKTRWALVLICLYCDSRRVVKRGWRNGLYQRYCCKDCGRWFNDRTGTAMTYSRLPLWFWFFTAFMMQSKVSIKELAETLQHPYATISRPFDLEDMGAFYTDDYPVYNFLRSLSLHETVNHSLGEYAKSGIHTNTVEGEF